MSKIRNTGITDQWHTCYVVTATQNVKDLRNSSLWTCSHLMAILRSQNENTNFFMILAWLCRFNYPMILIKKRLFTFTKLHMLIISLIDSPSSQIVARDVRNIRSRSCAPSLAIACIAFNKDKGNRAGQTDINFLDKRKACILSTSLSRQMSIDLQTNTVKQH